MISKYDDERYYAIFKTLGVNKPLCKICGFLSFFLDEQQQSLSRYISYLFYPRNLVF